MWHALGVVAVTHLPRVVPAEGQAHSLAGDDHPMRRITRLVAFDEAAWDAARSAEVLALFDGLAPGWASRAKEPRLAVVADAIERGGPIRPGRWLELGSGTGLLTPWLAARTELLVAADLSLEMLRHAPTGVGARVRLDGARLPLAAASLDSVVLVNAFLFPSEVRRVLAPHGALVWVNTGGPGTPIYLPADDVVAALGPGWCALASEASWGTWAVARRDG